MSIFIFIFIFEKLLGTIFFLKNKQQMKLCFFKEHLNKNTVKL